MDLSFPAFFISCHKQSPSWDVGILAPVVNASMSINNIISSPYIKNNPDSTVSLVFTDSLYNLNIDTLLNIPDTVLVYDTASPFNATINPGQEMFGMNPTTTQYPIGSVELTERDITIRLFSLYTDESINPTC